MTDDLFGATDIHKALESGDVTDPHGDAQEAPTMNDSAPELDSAARVWEGGQCVG